MAERLGAACRDAREQAGVRQIDVQLEAELKSEGTISKFEAGTGGWSLADRIVDAYAALVGVESDDLWRAALDREE